MEKKNIYSKLFLKSGIILSLQYGIDQNIEDKLDKYFGYVTLLFHGIIAFLLNYALHFHLVYRYEIERRKLFAEGSIILSSKASFKSQFLQSKFKCYHTKFSIYITLYIILFISFIFFSIMLIL